MYLIQGNFGHKGNFELVVREGNKLRHYWRNNDSGLSWNRSAIFGDKADSAPALIQSNCGNKGNFELVVREGEKLRHYWRNNDSGLSWNKRAIFGNLVDSAPALIQSNFGHKGNFELVVREGEKLRHYWRDMDASGLPWHAGVPFGDGVDSAPALIRSNFGVKRNFELVVREGEKLRHYWRDNDAPGLPWKKGVLFGDSVDSAPALIQSNFGYTGNFELVVREGERIRHYWRDNHISGYPWKKGVLFGDGVD